MPENPRGGNPSRRLSLGRNEIQLGNEICLSGVGGSILPRMARLPQLWPILLAVAFVCGLGFGVYFGSRPVIAVKSGSGAATASESMGPADAVTRDVEDAKLQIRVRDLQRDLDQEKRRQNAAILADHIAFAEKYHFGLQSVEQDMKVTPAMASFLMMTDAETKAVEDHFQTLGNEMKEYDRANIKLVKQDGTTVAYQIPPSPKGADLQNALKEEVQGDIGPDRAQIFMEGAKWTLAEGMPGLDTRPSGLEITQSEHGGTFSYHIKQSYGNGSMEQDTTTMVIPQPWTDLIQPDVQK